MARISRKKVLEKVAQYWPSQDPQQILTILDKYGTESYEREVIRVQLAVLMLSEGDQDRLKENVTLAKTDYRDVLAYAEYPEEMKYSYKEMSLMPANKAIAIRKRDREQYSRWLNS